MFHEKIQLQILFFVYNCRKNLELGVKTGMVRALEDCKSGLNAFKEKYPQIAISDKPSGVFQEWYTKRYRSPYFLRSLNKEVEGQWKAFSNGKTVNESLYIALEKGIGEPVLELIQYLEHKHMRHCLPNNVSRYASVYLFVYLSSRSTK